MAQPPGQVRASPEDTRKVAKEFPSIEAAHRDFIGGQRIFFTASAARGSRVNVSPRSTDAFRILGPNEVAFLDMTGSGCETAAHVRADGRLTVMFCAFEGPPLILRLYGTGRSLPRRTEPYQQMLAAHFGGAEPLGARQIVALEVELLKTSCGYGVPFMDYRGERPSMRRWAEAKGPEGLAAYWREKNVASMDGLPTGLLEADAPAEA